MKLRGMAGQSCERWENLLIEQRCDGYKCGPGTLLLAEFCRNHLRYGAHQVMDLGCGCAALPILLASRFPQTRFVGLELLSEQVDQARGNIVVNGLEEQIQIDRGDIVSVPSRYEPESQDAVITNPPSHPMGEGRIGPNCSKNIAEYEISCKLADISTAAAWLLRPKGQLLCIYPARRMVDVLVRFRQDQLEPKRVQTVRFGQSSFVLVEARRGAASGVIVEDMPGHGS